MSVQVKKHHPALKHAGYSAIGLLPGESVSEFEKLRRDLVAELTPSGALENDIVTTMARLVWRKKNLKTFRIAELARDRFDGIMREKVPENKVYSNIMLGAGDDAALREAVTQAADQAHEELGDAFELVEVYEIANVDHLMKDLDVQDRLDAMTDKCLKRLLFLRGLKSISTASSQAPQERLAGPSRAA